MGEFATPLLLASPPEKSKRVKDARFLLAGTNAFQTDFKPGPVTSVMNGQIIAATRRALWLLGFPLPIRPVFTQELYDILTGKTPLPAPYKRRRAARLAHQATTKQKALASAKHDAQLAIHETPAGSNLNPYGKEYGFDGVAWCCIFVTVKLVEAGSKDWVYARVDPAHPFAAYVGAVVDAAAHGQRHLSLTNDPEPGDLVAYNRDEHIEFFDGWIDRAAGSFRAVGGNTSAHDGSPANGGEVAENTRSTSGPFKATAFVAVGA